MQNITVLCKNYRNSEFWQKTILLYAKHHIENFYNFVEQSEEYGHI